MTKGRMRALLPLCMVATTAPMAVADTALIIAIYSHDGAQTLRDALVWGATDDLARLTRDTVLQPGADLATAVTRISGWAQSRVPFPGVRAPGPAWARAGR